MAKRARKVKLYTEATRNSMRFFVVDLVNLSERTKGMTKDQAMEVLHNECVKPVCKIYRISESEHVERCASDSIVKVNSMLLDNYREARHMIALMTAGDIGRGVRLNIAGRMMRDARFNLMAKDGETVQ